MLIFYRIWSCKQDEMDPDKQTDQPTNKQVDRQRKETYPSSYGRG